MCITPLPSLKLARAALFTFFIVSTSRSRHKRLDCSNTQKQTWNISVSKLFLTEQHCSETESACAEMLRESFQRLF